MTDLPTPPCVFEDREGRGIEVRAAGSSAFEALVAMYDDFDPADRAQGIPPADEASIRDWLDGILAEEAVNVVAWHGDRAVGHATLVPDAGGDYELAIFVHQNYQRAGIGTRLMRCLLGRGREAGIDRVWLTVERWNEAAITLYREMGFETTNAQSFEFEMAREL